MVALALYVDIILQLSDRVAVAIMHFASDLQSQVCALEEPCSVEKEIFDVVYSPKRDVTQARGGPPL